MQVAFESSSKLIQKLHSDFQVRLEVRSPEIHFPDSATFFILLIPDAFARELTKLEQYRKSKR